MAFFAMSRLERRVVSLVVTIIVRTDVALLARTKIDVQFVGPKTPMNGRILLSVIDVVAGFQQSRKVAAAPKTRRESSIRTKNMSTTACRLRNAGSGDGMRRSPERVEGSRISSSDISTKKHLKWREISVECGRRHRGSQSIQKDAYGAGCEPERLVANTRLASHLLLLTQSSRA